MAFSSAVLTAASASGWLASQPAVPLATVASADDRPEAVQPGWAAARLVLMQIKPLSRMTAAAMVPTTPHTLKSDPYQLLLLSPLMGYALLLLGQVLSRSVG